jgi:Protein of unknown function (DUF2844)
MKMMRALLPLLCLCCAPAWAALGQPAESIESDGRAMQGEIRKSELQGYTLHEINRADGTLVREFVSPAGIVFGVSWDGPVLPNLGQLLASYFPQFQQAMRSTTRRRGPVSVHIGTLVVQSGGHMRSYHGRAYLTSHLPANLSQEVIK